MKVKSQKSKVKSKTKKLFFFLRLFTFCFLLFTFLGCEAFVRKFTRKSKKDEAPGEQMVLAPIEYQPLQMTSEEKYRQSFLYWKSWQDELIDSLSNSANHKRQKVCVNETIKNLEELNPLLKQAGRQKLAVYLNQLSELKKSIEDDSYNYNGSIYRNRAERLRRDILKDFSYKKIKKDLL